MTRSSKDLVPIRQGHKTNPAKVSHGAYQYIKAYRADAIDRRKQIGRWITEQENGYAKHLGYGSFRSAPIPVRDYIGLIIACKLMLMKMEPGGKTGFRDIATIQNTLSRLVRDLGLKPTEKGIGLDDWLEVHAEEVSE